MEGIIKFKAKWNNLNSILKSEFEYIDPWRKLCYDKQYIGVGEDGIGYGNISFRIGDSNKFIISGSATGNISSLKIEHYSKVIDFDIEQNSLFCEGLTIASSESLSHAAIYQSNNYAKCVIHIHNNTLWKRNIEIISTTDSTIEYGSVEMAKAISNLSKGNERGTIIMGGHKDGIIVFGDSFEVCIELLENL
jgi:ribulose-5-phosphate 4-epimerase/fuculose-1-phosphate aldolase